MVIRGGDNVYPREIEEILYSHREISEAAVLRVPRSDLGQEVAAIVVLRDGAKSMPDEIRIVLKDRAASYRYPRLIQVVKALPKTATGKMLKKAIPLEI